MTKIRKLAGSHFLEATTLEEHRHRHPRCRGGRGQLRELAWLGDALLYLVTTKFIVRQNGFGSDDVKALGELNSRRDMMVSRASLYQIALRLNLQNHLRRGGKDSADKVKQKNLLPEIVEALIGAIYKQSGEEAAQEFIQVNIIDQILSGDVCVAGVAQKEARPVPTRQKEKNRRKMVIDQAEKFLLIRYQKVKCHHLHQSAHVSLKMVNEPRPMCQWVACETCGTSAPKTVAEALALLEEKNKAKQQSTRQIVSLRTSFSWDNLEEELCRRNNHVALAAA